MTSTPDPRSQPETDEPLLRLLGRIWRDYLRRRWWTLLGAALCGVGVAAFAGLLIQTLNPAVNGLLVLKDPKALTTIPLMIVLYVLLRAAFQIGQAMLVNQAGHRVVSDMQVQLFGKLVRADLARLRSAHTGTYVSSVLYDANLIRQAFTDGMVTYFREALTVVAMVGVMFVNDP